MPEKISICLNRGREESVGNDDVSIVCAHKYQMVRMTERQKILKGPPRATYLPTLPTLEAAKDPASPPPPPPVAQVTKA